MVADTITERYQSVVDDTLTTVRKTESSLKRLKGRRGGVGETEGGEGAASTDQMLCKQLLLDVQVCGVGLSMCKVVCTFVYMSIKAHVCLNMHTLVHQDTHFHTHTHTHTHLSHTNKHPLSQEYGRQLQRFGVDATASPTFKLLWAMVAPPGQADIITL